MIKECKIELTNKGFAICKAEDIKIFIHSSKLYRANNGDIVNVKITREATDTSLEEGEVVKIIKQSKNNHIGIIRRYKKQRFFFIESTTTSKDVYIKETKRIKKENYKSGDVVIFQLEKNQNQKNPTGIILEYIGNEKDFKVKEYIKLYSNGISESFDKDIIAEIKNEKLQNIKRKDLTKLNFITIDGETAKDLDDAIYYEKTDKGHKLYVSIADVSYYVKKDSLTDKEAQKRGNSTYLIKTVVPMLPHILSNELCSLNPNTEKNTFTVEITYDDKYKSISTDIYVSKIISKKRCTYTEVNRLYNLVPQNEIENMLFQMKDFADKLKKMKLKKGLLEFNYRELQFNENLEPIYRDRGIAEKLIETFMIEANEAVAEYIFWQDAPTLYRIHDRPEQDNIKSLNDYLSTIDKKYMLPTTRDIEPYDFQNLLNEVKDKELNLLLNKKIIRTLPKARYDTEAVGHFGLSSKYYLHFTSPIRRYADLIVHRYLKEILKGKIYSEKQRYKLIKKLKKISEHINFTENRSEKIERSTIKLASLVYVDREYSKVDNFIGTVVGETDRKVYFEDEKGIEFMHFKHDNTKYLLGDKYKLKIKNIDYSYEEIEVFENGICK